MGNVNAANLKPEEIEEFSLMSNCMISLRGARSPLTPPQSPSWS